MSDEERTSATPLPLGEVDAHPELVEGDAAGEGPSSRAAPGSGRTDSAPRPPRLQDWRQTGLALLVLLSGIVIGACGAVIIGKQMLVSSIARGPDDMPGEVVDRIAMDLRLSPDQIAQVHEIIGRRMRRVEEIRSSHFQDVAQEFDLMRDEVAQVLPPEQARMWRQRFDEARRLGFAAPPHRGPWFYPQGPVPPGGAPPDRGGPPRGPSPEGKGSAVPFGSRPGR